MLFDDKLIELVLKLTIRNPFLFWVETGLTSS